MSVLIIALAAALSGSPEASGSSPPANPAVQQAASRTEKPADDPNRVICKSEEVTGARFLRKVCLTRAQWTERQLQADRFMRETDSHSGISADAPATTQ